MACRVSRNSKVVRAPGTERQAAAPSQLGRRQAHGSSPLPDPDAQHPIAGILADMRSPSVQRISVSGAARKAGIYSVCTTRGGARLHPDAGADCRVNSSARRARSRALQLVHYHQPLHSPPRGEFEICAFYGTGHAIEVPRTRSSASRCK